MPIRCWSRPARAWPPWQRHQRGRAAEVVQHTLVLEYNNVAQLEEAFALHGKGAGLRDDRTHRGNMNFVRASVPFMKPLP